MKILLSLIFSLGAIAQTVLLNEKLEIESFSTEIIPLSRVTYVGRLEIRVKREGSLFNSKDGLIRIIADGVEVDCIRYYESTSREWRNFVVNVGRTVRVLEIYNGLDRDVKIKGMRSLPWAHYGRVPMGQPSQVMDLAAQLIDITSSLEQMVTTSDMQRLAMIRLSASELMNKVQILGPLQVANEIEDLIDLLEQSADLIDRLKNNQLTGPLALEIDYVQVALSRLVGESDFKKIK